MNSEQAKDLEHSLSYFNPTKNEWIQPQKQIERCAGNQDLGDLTLVRAQKYTQRMLGEELAAAPSSSYQDQVRRDQVRRVSVDAAQKFALHLRLKTTQIPPQQRNWS
jgi:hypothetical protein